MDSMKFHCGHELRVMDLNSKDAMGENSPTPRVIEVRGLAENGGDAFEKPQAFLGLLKGEAQSSSRRCGPGTHVPEFGNVLKCCDESFPRILKMPYRPSDVDVTRVVPVGEAEQDAGVEEDGHQS